MSFRDQIIPDKVPQHIAIIMDGNGRWALKKGDLRLAGHEQGVHAVKKVIEAAAEVGVKYVTLYAFSKENWSRPQEEVDALMSLLVKSINAQMESLMQNNIRLNAIGDLNSLPTETLQELNQAIHDTSSNTGLTMILALSYGSKWEITEAIKSIAESYKHNEIELEDINEQLISNHLTTSDFPNPELLIRTSGEIRISNFLLWQIAYSELYFTETLWPDFGAEDLFKAIVDFQQRERRFGKTSAQIKE